MVKLTLFQRVFNVLENQNHDRLHTLKSPLQPVVPTNPKGMKKKRSAAKAVAPPEPKIKITLIDVSDGKENKKKESYTNSKEAQDLLEFYADQI